MVNEPQHRQNDVHVVKQPQHFENDVVNKLKQPEQCPNNILWLSSHSIVRVMWLSSHVQHQTDVVTGPQEQWLIVLYR